MAQVVYSQTILAGHRMILVKKPHVSTRIFLSIRALADDTTWAMSKISFGDPYFYSYYILDGPAKYFEMKGEGIFQGDIWVRNASGINLTYLVSEILI